MNRNGLAQAVGTVASSASRLCDQLVAAGTVDRKTNPYSRREGTVNLSVENCSRLDARHCKDCSRFGAAAI